MPKHKWKFKSCFRSEMYGWNGTAKASKRMKEAVSEIKKVAKNDSSLAGEGVVELFVRLYPALMNIDGSSGSLGNSIHYTVTWVCSFNCVNGHNYDTLNYGGKDYD